MELPADFVHNVLGSSGADGKRFLEQLPALLDETAQKWGLRLGPPFMLSYNYVCVAQRADGTPVVLKAGVPNPELTSEIHALSLFGGTGTCRLLESDEANGLLLLERLSPGKMLSTLDDDERRTHIAVEVMRRLWRDAPSGPFIQLSDWFGELSKLRPRFAGGTGPFPRWLVEHAEARLPDLFTAGKPFRLIHGDLHHYNILSSERGWLAVDPKGVIGPPAYEVGPLLINPWNELLAMPDAVGVTARRIAILSEELGFPREIIRDWGLCHCLLSTWWNLTDEDTLNDHALRCADMIRQADG